jgi:hypothetical protein
MNKIFIAAAAVIALGNTAIFASTSTITTTQPTDRPQSPMMGMMGGLGMMKDHNMNGAQDKPGTKKNNQDMKKDNMMSTDIIKAIEANDYNAFVTAFNNQLTKRVTPTQTEFATMVTKAKEMEANKSIDDKTNALQTAIKANDYTAFVKAFEANKPTLSNGTSSMAVIPTPTQSEFSQLITMHNNHEAMKNALLANDYTAFVKAFEANKPTVPTQEEFTKMVEMHKNMKTAQGTLKNAKAEVKNSKRTLKTIRKEWTVAEKYTAKAEVKEAKTEVKEAKKTVKSTRQINKTTKKSSELLNNIILCFSFPRSVKKHTKSHFL